jgi:carbon storage regulator
MLVLSRKPGERILIGDSVTVTIVRIGPNTVRLGIEAPRELNIVREELCINIPSENAATDGTADDAPSSADQSQPSV